MIPANTRVRIVGGGPNWVEADNARYRDMVGYTSRDIIHGQNTTLHSVSASNGLNVGTLTASFYYHELQILDNLNLIGGNNMNILVFSRLNKEQRQLAKAGIIGEDGNLTSDGQRVVMEQLAASEDVQKSLIALAKEYNKKAE